MWSHAQCHWIRILITLSELHGGKGLEKDEFKWKWTYRLGGTLHTSKEVFVGPFRSASSPTTVPDQKAHDLRVE